MARLTAPQFRLIFATMRHPSEEEMHDEKQSDGCSCHRSRGSHVDWFGCDGNAGGQARGSEPGPGPGRDGRLVSPRSPLVLLLVPAPPVRLLRDASVLRAALRLRRP